MEDHMKHSLTFFIALLLAPLAALHAADKPVAASDDWAQEISTRRSEYLHWIVENFGTLELTMDPRDGRRWALNHARLVLSRDVAKANEYFESFTPPGGDNDIYLIRFLRTLLDFRDSPRLSDAAEKHIIRFVETWPTSKKQLGTRAHWPPGFTENHDLMYLTLALFGEQYRGGDGGVQVREIKKFIAHRMERGFVEWNSKCYQYHFSNPLIILVDHAPDEMLRKAAQDLLNIMLAERALLSVNGYLGGPSLRCRTADRDHSLTARKVAYLTDARYDGFLPTVWLSLGMGEPRFDFEKADVPGLEPASVHIASGNEPRLKQDEGMFFACSEFVPHPVVQALAAEARTRKALIYQGQRFTGWPGDELWKTQKWIPGSLYYYNTPHVSMGSVHSDGWIHQCRYNSVIFGADPSQALRVETIMPGVPPHKRRREARGRVVQHDNWLLGQHVCAEFQQMRLLLDVTPKMNTRTHAGHTRLAKDGFTRLKKIRMVVLFRHAEAAREVMRSDQHTVEIGDLQNLVQGVHGRGAFDIDYEKTLRSALANVVFQPGSNRFAFQHCLLLLTFDGAHLYSAPQLLNLLNGFDVRRDDSCGTSIKDHRSGMWIGRGNSHNRRNAERRVRLTHPTQLSSIQGNVLRIDKHEVQSAGRDYFRPAR
jgi:hypothetical protein